MTHHSYIMSDFCYQYFEKLRTQKITKTNTVYSTITQAENNGDN